MDGNGISKGNKSATWIAIVIVAVVAISLYLWFYGNPFAPKTSAALTVNIANCDSVSPQTGVVADGQVIAFKNTDGSDHRINIGGKSLNVPAKGSIGLTAKLQYGTGTYGYSCDNKLTPNQIVLVPIPGSAATAQVTFKYAYDQEAASAQACLKSALGAEFDKAYNDSTYVPSNDAMGKVNTCLIPQTASIPSTTKK